MLAVVLERQDTALAASDGVTRSVVIIERV